MLGTGKELSALFIEDGDEEALSEVGFGGVHGAEGLLGILP